MAWRANSSGDPIKVSLTGYGEVDNLMLEAFRKSERLIALDLSPQFQATVDEIDRDFPEGGAPFLFDHHQSTFERYSNRPWIVVDMNRCGAAVYWDWLMDGNADDETLERIEPMRGMVSVANDRDLWINENPDGRLWQAMVTLCGEWGALARLITNPSASFTEPELAVVTKFIESQEKRFNRAREHLVRSPVRGLGESGELAFLGDGYLEFGDTSDFCGSILDRPEGGAAPLIAAISYRKPGGNWAVSLRSRGGLAGHVVSLLKDGRKIRGGGHGDAAALYFPSHYNEESIRESIAAALAAKSESSSGMGVTLGDLLKGTMQ
ncbi:MAG: phosphohydrolase [Synergistaceae bacterium]|nr:phosphohydrolase [Synergistaceae bacterium]